jgi:predicted acylesterase/phospholipase RssA
MKRTGLVLQGGGALGAYEFGVLKRLFEEPGFRPDVVSGVSIGAINAAAVVGARNGDPIATLAEMWRRFEVISSPLMPDAIEQFVALAGNASFFSMRFDYFNLLRWTSFYSVEPLRATLEELIDFRRINRGDQRLIVTATNIETGQVECFDKEISVDHILASGSLPPGFPITLIDGKAYWDGGLFDNTPLGPVIDALDAPDSRLIVVNLFAGGGRVPGNMLDVFDRMFEIIFSNKIEEDVKLLQRFNEIVEVMEQIDKALPTNSKVRKMPGYSRLTHYKRIRRVTYITNRDPEMVFGPFDFSRASIARRRDAGYHDADEALKAA